MRRLASAFVLSLALTAPAFADTPTAPAAPAAPEPGKDKPKDKSAKAPGLVCTTDTPTGSRFPVKVCTTPEQRKAQRRNVDGAQDRMQGGGAPVIPN